MYCRTLHYKKFPTHLTNKSRRYSILKFTQYCLIILSHIIDGGGKMDLETIKNLLGWNSPIGVGIFFVCSGITVYILTLALQNLVNL
jgi:hypothetical protein